MSLSPGTRLGTFEITSQLGAGGMGEVYCATDTRLNRTVAIKVLPQQYTENAMMKQRFEREAKVIASLNHPNICILYDVGRQTPTATSPGQGVSEGHASTEIVTSAAPIDFLVMEYLDGETLSKRLERGPLPVDEALQVGMAIADALDKAHRQGITHRDLKPANVMLTGRGSKLLDFGLAKLSTGQAIVVGSTTQAEQGLTEHGAILGTFQYMAPEQLEGIEADARTDIFAFGAVLYEMVTGQKAFQGKSRVRLMSAIATADPAPISKLQPASPEVLDHVVRTCLAKEPSERWQTAGDLLAELAWIADGGGKAALAIPLAGGQRSKSRLVRFTLGPAAVLGAVLAVPTVRYLQGPAEAGEFRYRVPITVGAQPADVNTSLGGGSFFDQFNPNRNFLIADFALSPNGTKMAYVASASGRVGEDSGGRGAPAGTSPYFLVVRPVDSLTPTVLAGTEEARHPFWSPKGDWIGFAMGGKLKKVKATGGQPEVICDAADFSGGTWNSDGTILFGTLKGLLKVRAEGGKPEPVTTLEAGETGHFWPRFLPDGRQFLYLAWAGQGSERAIFAGSLDAKMRTKIVAAESSLGYTEPGLLLFRRDSAVYAQPFDPKMLALSGEPVRVADEVDGVGNGQSSFDVSRNGVLLYLRNAGPAVRSGSRGGSGGIQSELFLWELAWAERGGTLVATVGVPGVYRGVELSPDGTRVAVHQHDGAGGNVFIFEPPPQAATQLTSDPKRDNSNPIWSPEGKWIAYSAVENGKWGIYRTLSDGSGTEELLYEDEYLKAPMSWNGTNLVFWIQHPTNAGDIWILSTEGEKQARVFLASPWDERHPQVSPDGKWIAFSSTKNAARREIFVRPFPTGTGEWVVSTGGGDWPRWTRDGKELLYHAINHQVDQPEPSVSVVDNSGGAGGGPLLSAQVRAEGAAFRSDRPREVVRFFALNYPHRGGDYHTFDISPNGERILYFRAIVAGGTSGGGVITPTPEPLYGLTVARGWAPSVRKK